MYGRESAKKNNRPETTTKKGRKRNTTAKCTEQVTSLPSFFFFDGVLFASLQMQLKSKGNGQKERKAVSGFFLPPSSVCV
jgi:hypothetical protein